MKTLADIKGNIDIIIPRGQLSILRHHMPQIEEKDYPEFFYLLSLRSIEFHRSILQSKILKAAQKEIDLDKVREWMKSMPLKARKKPCIVSKDLYILDGNHTWLAKLNKNHNSTIECFVVDLNMVDLLNIIRLFDKVTYKT